jgi:hypothetical protein
MVFVIVYVAGPNRHYIAQRTGNSLPPVFEVITDGFENEHDARQAIHEFETLDESQYSETTKRMCGL